ncbi:glutamine synthetase family protein [Agarivorans sp. MS3-6]
MLKHKPQTLPLSLVEQVQEFLNDHPQLKSVDLMLADMNGVIRGKRIEVGSLLKIAEEGMCLPASVFALDICGETVEQTGLGFAQGDGDRICHLLPHSLSMIPWKNDAAQALLTMHEVDGRPFFADPRQLLCKALKGLHQQEYFPCVAIEWEFYLLDAAADTEQPLPPLLPLSQQRMEQTQVYSLDELDEFAEFIQDIQRYCHTQNIPSDNVIAEYAPGQFEVTLQHQTDPLLACDQAILLKRAIKAVAKKHGYNATFMAKPYAEHSGNGCHVHISMLDAQGKNVFAEDLGVLHYALAGLLDTMPQAIALLAPNANSYRRFQPDMFVPLQANWGWDNRTVALRIPSGSKQNTRIEHRVAGADCNPYIVMSALLFGIQHGLAQQLSCAEPVSGDASKEHAPALPTSWEQALNEFHQSSLWHLLGDDFSHVYHANKLNEWQRFEAAVTPLEQQWYQQMV